MDLLREYSGEMFVIYRSNKAANKSKYPQGCGIYAIENIESGKRYVGSSQNMERRLPTHVWKLRKRRLLVESYLKNIVRQYQKATFADGKRVEIRPFNFKSLFKSAMTYGEIMSNPRLYSTKFEDHHGLIHKFARGGYSRLIGAGVSIDYEDVFQEMCISYVKAVEKYDPDTGIGFSAYMGRTVINNFNKYAERELRTHFGLGIMSVEDMALTEDHHDPLDILDVDRDEQTVEERLIAKQEMRLKSRFLTKNAKSVIRELINPTVKFKKFAKEAGQQHSIRLICRFLNLDTVERARLKIELKREFGVEI